MNNEELQNFENELRKLKPARFQPQRPQRTPKNTFSVNSVLSVANKKTVFSLTHTVGILTGILLGGGFVHFLQKPVVVERVVVRYVEKRVEPPPVTPPETPAVPKYARMPLSIDEMIEQYNRRGRLLADLPVSRVTYSRSSTPSWASDDPNSMMRLREQL